MKILHLNTHSGGGAYKAAERLNIALNCNGLESCLMTRNNFKSFNISHSLIDKIKNSISWRIHNKKIYKINSNLEIASPINSPFKNREFNQIPDSDIINLHWINDFIDYKSFFRKFVGIRPIVWTLHDMNTFLGICHYKNDSDYLKKSIGGELDLGNYKRKDIDNIVYLKKKEIFENIQPDKLIFVTPSKWLKSEAENSELLSKFKIHNIPNSLDITIFKPLDKLFCRNILNIPTEKKMILFCSESLNNKRKGFSVLLKVLANYPDKNIQLYAIGKKPKNECINPQIKYLGYLNDKYTLSLAYNSADLFIIPTLEDNLPNTVLESLACGTAVIGSNVGGVPDMVRSEITGMLFQKGNSEELASKIEAFFSLSDLKREEISDNCRKIAVKEYSYEIQAKAYIELYKSILDR